MWVFFSYLADLAASAAQKAVWSKLLLSRNLAIICTSKVMLTDNIFGILCQIQDSNLQTSTWSLFDSFSIGNVITTITMGYHKKTLISMSCCHQSKLAIKSKVMSD